MLLAKSRNAYAPTLANFIDDVFKTFPGETSFRPAVNIYETESAFELELVAPGFEKNQFEMKVEKNVLTVSARTESSASETENAESEAAHEPQQAQDDESFKIIRKEYRRMAFSRAFSLPDTVDSAQIKARYEAGILKITLPKRAELAPWVQHIEVE